MTIAKFISEGRYLEAAEDLRRQVAINPRSVSLLLQLSYACFKSGRNQEAIQTLQQVLAQRPNHGEALTNLALIYAHQGDLIAATRYSQLAVQQDPRNPERHHLLASVWSDRFRYDYASDVLTEALRLAPHRHAWRADLISYLKKANRVEQIAKHVAQLRAHPGDPDECDVLLLLLSHSLELSEWDSATVYEIQLPDALARFLKRRGSPQPLRSSRLMFYIDDPEVLYRTALTSPPNRASALTAAPRRYDGKIVVCYLSADVRMHPVAHMLLPVLTCHDRTRFHLVLGALSPTDESSVARAIYDLVDEVLPLYRLDDRQAAQAIRDYGIDTLVDLGGVTLGGRPNILAFRPAQQQLLWLGCPVTTGQHHYDGWIVDSRVAPPGYEAFCSEPLIRLPLCYHPISLGEPSQPSAKVREDFSLGNNAIVVGLLMQPNRIKVGFLRRVVSIIANHPRTILVLRVTESRHREALNLLASWDLPEERVRLIDRIRERQDYLALVRCLDLFLDGVPYGGHSTVGEALCLGVPVVACWGKSVHARVAGSMMTEFGLGDLVAPDPPCQLQQLHNLLHDDELRQDWKNRFHTATGTQMSKIHQLLAGQLERQFSAKVNP